MQQTAGREVTTQKFLCVQPRSLPSHGDVDSLHLHANYRIQPPLPRRDGAKAALNELIFRARAYHTLSTISTPAFPIGYPAPAFEKQIGYGAETFSLNSTAKIEGGTIVLKATTELLCSVQPRQGQNEWCLVQSRQGQIQ